MFKGEYSDDWRDVANQVKTEANWHCIRCGHVHQVSSGHVLTVHHFDGDKSNNQWWNLLALCQRCHLSFQSRVNPEVPYMFEHSDWLKPFVAGFYAQKYLGESLTKKEASERLEELLELERIA